MLSRFRYLAAITVSLICTTIISKAQNYTSKENFTEIDTAIFQDAAHHWYDIFEKDRIINPRKDKPRYKAAQLKEIADNILLYQKENGGWPKNYDMLAILTRPQKDSLRNARKQTNTTFDNRNTYTQIACLAQVYYVTGIKKYKQAALKGFEYILAAQYKNGGWPQYYPLQTNYSRHITYNDDVFTGIMFLLNDVKAQRVQYNFIDSELRAKLLTAFNRGIQCILDTQISENGTVTAWCQQHDEKNLKPTWARSFEPPAICNAESADIVLLLMRLNNPSEKVIEAVNNAVKWFNDSKILNTRIKTISASIDTNKYTISKTDKVVVTDTTAPPIWTRYYELGTHRPLFCNREQKLVYSLAEVFRERRDGYAWYTYQPQKVLDRYAAWKKKWM